MQVIWWFGDINFYKELHFLIAAIEARLFFVPAGGHAGVFFKGFIKRDQGFEELEINFPVCYTDGR